MGLEPSFHVVRDMVLKPTLAQLCFRLSLSSLHEMLSNAPYKKLELEDFFQELPISSKCTFLLENPKINRCWYSDLMSQVLCLTHLNAPRLWGVQSGRQSKICLAYREN